VHEKVSVHGLAFAGEPIPAVFEHFAELAPRRVSFVSQQITGENLPETQRRLKATDYKVETVTHIFMPGQLSDRSGWDAARAGLSDTIQAAKAIGANSIYMLTGGRGPLTWEDAADAFAEAVAPCNAEAKAAGVKLLIEPAPMLYAAFHIAHSLRDTVLLAEIADIGVCMDVFPIWTEAGLKETIKRAAPRLGLVQIGDHIPGDMSLPNRAVVGDGAIPMKRLFGWALEAGYDGGFDLEMIGPRIVAMGPVEALRRSAEAVGKILEELGA
jgi:sugar phosphate isomerase/epimerase